METLRLRIAGPTDRTLANFTVTHGLAFGISAAWVPGTAEVGALVHDAGLVVKTFRVVIAVSNLGCMDKWNRSTLLSQTLRYYLI